MKADKLNKRITSTLDDLLHQAKASGLTQQELARRAGISPVGLSQAKRRGDLRVSTLEALANAAGLAITFTPLRQRDRAIGAIRRGNFFQIGDDE